MRQNPNLNWNALNNPFLNFIEFIRSSCKTKTCIKKLLTLNHQFKTNPSIEKSSKTIGSNITKSMNEIYKITVLYAELSQPKQATTQKNSFLREKKISSTYKQYPSLATSTRKIILSSSKSKSILKIPSLSLKPIDHLVQLKKNWETQLRIQQTIHSKALPNF